MPLIEVYLCPRSDRLFRTKEDYVLHLKEMARQSLVDKRQQRATLLLTPALQQLQRSARSGDDIRNWFPANVALLVAASACAVPTKKVHPLDRSRLAITRFNVEVDHFSFRVEPITHGMMEFNASADLQLGHLFEKNNVFQIPCRYVTSFKSNGAKTVDFTLDATLWPFLAAPALYQTHHASSLGLSTEVCPPDFVARCLTTSFPGMPLSTYEDLADAGLLPDTEEAFSAWLFQYIDPMGPAVQASVSACLPAALGATIAS